jgi:hypothetical protein
MLTPDEFQPNFFTFSLFHFFLSLAAFVSPAAKMIYFSFIKNV